MPCDLAACRPFVAKIILRSKKVAATLTQPQRTSMWGRPACASSYRRVRDMPTRRSSWNPSGSQAVVGGAMCATVQNAPSGVHTVRRRLKQTGRVGGSPCRQTARRGKRTSRVSTPRAKVVRQVKPGGRHRCFASRFASCRRWKQFEWSWQMAACVQRCELRRARCERTPGQPSQWQLISHPRARRA